MNNSTFSFLSDLVEFSNSLEWPGVVWLIVFTVCVTVIVVQPFRRRAK